MRPTPLLLALVVTLLVAVDVAAQPGFGELVCARGMPSRQADRSLRFVARKATMLGLAVDVTKTRGLCLPVGAAGATSAFESYAVRLSRTRPPQSRPALSNQRIANRFGVDELAVKGVDGVLVPASAVLDPPPAPSSVPAALGAFACWEVDRASGRSAPAAAAPLALASALGTWQLDVRAPTRLCVPADLDGAAAASENATVLVCYRAALARTKPRQGKPFPREAAVTNRFGAEQLTLAAFVELCVPSEASPVGATATPTPEHTTVPTPTVAPTPADFTLRIDPAATSVDLGESTHLKATATFTNGDTADFSERVVWSSSSPAVEAPNVAGDRGRVDAVDAGSAVISVLDPATGVGSTASGADAIVTVNATLDRLELQPVTITRGVGESFRLRAVGHFAGGYTTSIAQRVTYASSDPSVGNPTNDADPSEHARVLALAAGTTVLSATDPLSGLASTATGDDVTFTVVPPLERCTILNQGPITLVLGHEYQLTAHGSYPGGFERNLTQQVVWTSSAPDVLEAPNAAGDRSRVKALAPGDTQVTATDSVTGVACEGSVTFQVRVPTDYIGVYTSGDPLAGRPRRVGDSWHLRAVQSFVGPYDWKYVTEKVLFSSSDPTIVSAPNTPGDHGRIYAVGSGTATVIATDPVDGRTSGPIVLRSLDGLTRIAVQHRRRDGTPSIVMPGLPFGIEVIGQFADGPERLEPADFTIVSSNPAVAEPYQPGLARAVGYGHATVSAVDTRTGIGSDAFGESLSVAVPGPLQRLELVPAATTIRVGGSHAFAAVAHYEGDVTDNLTQRLLWAASDPAIAVAANVYGNASLVAGVAPGTTVVHATDPVTGASSADTGDGATLTVVGPLQRLRIEPSGASRSVGRSFGFTAIGTDADGREINLTQAVTWSSSDPTVAVATNDEGNRSRVQALTEGTTTISAFDPVQGLSSTASGDDATFTVSGVLQSLTLGAESTSLAVGDAVQLIATGHLVGGGAINLTQEVVYTSSDPAVAQAENAPGDRSRVVAVAPGTAVISAVDPGTGIATAPTGRVTLTVAAP